MLKAAYQKVSLSYKGASWIILGQLSAGVGALLLITILTSLLAPPEFGLLILLLGLELLIFNLFCRPILQAGIRFRSEAIADHESALVRGVVASFLRPSISFAIILVLVGGAGGSILGGMHPWIGAALAALLIADCLREREVTLLNAARRQKDWGLWQISEAAARPAFVLITAIFANLDACLVLVAYATSTFLVWAACKYAIGFEGSAKLNRNVQEYLDARRLLVIRIRKFALPFLPLSIALWIISVGDRYIISAMEGLSSAGLYAANYAIISAPFIRLNAVLETWLRPAMFAEFSSSERQRFEKTLHSWALIALVTGLFGLACTIVLHPFAAELLLSDEFQSGSHLMIPIAAGYVFFNISTPYLKVFEATERTPVLMWVQIITCIVSIGVTFPLVKVFGMSGAAWSVPAYFGFQFFISFALSSREINTLQKDVEAYQETSTLLIDDRS